MVPRHVSRGPNRCSRRQALGFLALGVGGALLASGRRYELAQAAAHRIRDDGEAGVELLHAWVEGDLPKTMIPAGWQVHAPARGAAFYYPPDWQVTTVRDPDINDLNDGNPFGNWIIAPDQSAAVLLLNVANPTPVEAMDAAVTELEAAFDDARLTELAADAYRRPQNVDMAFYAARADDVIGAVIALTNPDTLTGGTFIYFQLVLAQASRFDRMTERVFIPLLQHLVTDGGSACDIDPDDDDYTLDDCPSTSGD